MTRWIGKTPQPSSRRHTGFRALAAATLATAMLFPSIAPAAGGDYYEHIGWKVWEGGTAIGCKSQNTYSKLASLQSSGDMVAFKRELARRLLQQQCHVFERGEDVYLEKVDYSVWKLRPRGNPDGYWVKASKEILPSK